jgi:hypothetical protein
MRVQREKTEKTLAKEIDLSKKLIGDDKPADEIRGLFDNYDEEELREYKVKKDTALVYLKKFTEFYYEWTKQTKALRDAAHKVENSEEVDISIDELVKLKEKFYEEGFAGRIGKAIENFAEAAPDHMNIHNNLKRLWEIVTEENVEIEDINFCEYEGWREEIQKAVNTEQSRR